MPEASEPRNAQDDAIKGAGVALVAGYGFSLLCLIASEGDLANWRGWLLKPLLVLPLVGLVFFSWFVIPVGALVGVVLPRIAHHRPRRIAALLALVVSLGIGALWTGVMTLLLVLTRSLNAGAAATDTGGVVRLSPFLALYSLPWVAA